MIGKRKFKAFIITLSVCAVSYLAALLWGVQFSGDNVIAAMALYSALAGAFFGANFGEHWAQAKGTPKGGN